MRRARCAGTTSAGFPGWSAPECAAPLHLQLGSKNLDPGPWFVATTGFALAAGFDLVASVLRGVALLTIAPPGPKGPAYIALTIFLALGAASLTGLGANFRWRPAWARAARKRQWMIALAAFTAVGTGHALVGWMLAAYFT